MGGGGGAGWASAGLDVNAKGAVASSATIANLTARPACVLVALIDQP